MSVNWVIFALGASLKWTLEELQPIIYIMGRDGVFFLFCFFTFFLMILRFRVLNGLLIWLNCGVNIALTPPPHSFTNESNDISGLKLKFGNF